jgi:hypothetical protein
MPDRYNPSYRTKMGEVGQWTGLYDKHGKEICIGDTMKFDRVEWGSDDNEFIVEWERGELLVNGTIGDLSSWCEVVRSKT